MPTKNQKSKPKRKTAAAKHKKPQRGKGVGKTIKRVYRKNRRAINTAAGVLGGLTVLGFAADAYERSRPTRFINGTDGSWADVMFPRYSAVL